VNMPVVAVIRHVFFEDLGTFEDVLLAKGYDVQYWGAGTEDLSSLLVMPPDLLVVLGGPIGANDENGYPFLSTELRILETRFSNNQKTVGICLGAQLMARALGAQVYQTRAPEIGWSPLDLSGFGRASCCRHLGADKTCMLHWHADVFDLPDGCVALASTENCPVQAFSYGDCAIAFQCHPEVKAENMESWFIGHAHEIQSVVGISVAELRADTSRHGLTLERQGRACFSQWLEGQKEDAVRKGTG